MAGGYPKVELALIFICIFGAYYSISVAYAWMVAFITSVLALLYGLLGIYSPELLVLRLEETLAGAAVALLAASTLFPFKTSAKIHPEMAEVLRDAGALLADAIGKCPPPTYSEIMASIRAIDQKMQGLWQTADPVGGLVITFAAREMARRVHDVSVFVYCVRQIITADATRVSGGFRLKAADIARRLGDNAGALADALNSGRNRPINPAGESIERLRAEAVIDIDPERLLPVEWMDRVDRIIMDMADSLGVARGQPVKPSQA